MQVLIDKVVTLSAGVAFKSTLSDSDKASVEELYELLLHKKFIRRAGCQDCYRDAIVEIKIYLKQRTMNYILKNGALIYDANTNTHYTAANLTDEVAERVLGEFPALADQFAHIPAKATKSKVAAPKPAKAAKGKSEDEDASEDLSKDNQKNENQPE